MERSLVISYAVFALLLFCLAPVLFCSGTLAQLSFSWHHDLLGVVRRQKASVAAARLAAGEFAEADNGRRRQEYLRNTIADIGHDRPGFVTFDEVFDAKVYEVYRAVNHRWAGRSSSSSSSSSSNRKKLTTFNGQEEDALPPPPPPPPPPRTDALGRKLEDLILFGKVAERFAGRAKRFKVPKGKNDDEDDDDDDDVDDVDDDDHHTYFISDSDDEAAYRRLADDGDGDDTAWMHMALNDPGDGSEEL